MNKLTFASAVILAFFIAQMPKGFEDNSILKGGYDSESQKEVEARRPTQAQRQGAQAQPHTGPGKEQASPKKGRREVALTRKYEPLILVKTEGLTREEWLDFRRKGIGGSDAAAVLGISPFRTAVDLYYDKRNIVTADDEGNWVAMEMGNLLEPLVARIFAKKTGLNVYQRKCMFQHPHYPWMLADLDYLVELPDGKKAILEIKTTNYNARDHWWHNGKEIVPPYYEAQGRHYLAVMNIDRVCFCCLYGNSEDEVIIRSLDRDPAYEEELIALEENFWNHHVLAQTPPPFTESGNLILDCVLRRYGPADKSAPPVELDWALAQKVAKYLELQKEKSRLTAEAAALDASMQKMKALVVAKMGASCTAIYSAPDGCYTVTYKPSHHESIPKEALMRMKDQHPEIYSEYVKVSEPRRFNIKLTAPQAA